MLSPPNTGDARNSIATSSSPSPFCTSFQVTVRLRVKSPKAFDDFISSRSICSATRSSESQFSLRLAIGFSYCLFSFVRIICMASNCFTAAESPLSRIKSLKLVSVFRSSPFAKSAELSYTSPLLSISPAFRQHEGNSANSNLFLSQNVSLVRFVAPLNCDKTISFLCLTQFS